MSVLLHPNDGEDIVIPKEICIISGLLKTALESDDEKTPLIPINCDRKSLLKVVEYMKKIYTISPTKDLSVIPMISWSTQFSYNLVNYPTEEFRTWAEKFISSNIEPSSMLDIKQSSLSDKLENISYLAYAANYLDIPSLLSLCAAYIMHNLRRVDLIAHPKILDWNLDQKALTNFPKSSTPFSWYSSEMLSIDELMEKKLSGEDVARIDLVKKTLHFEGPSQDKKCIASSIIILKNGYFVSADNIYFQNEDALYLLANSLYTEDHLEQHTVFDTTAVVGENKYNIVFTRKKYMKDVTVTKGFIYPRESKYVPTMKIHDSVEELLKFGEKIIENNVSICGVSDESYSQRLRKIVPEPTIRQLLLNNFFNASKIFPIDIITMCFKYDIPSGPEYSCLPKHSSIDNTYEQNLDSLITTYGNMLIYGGEFSFHRTDNDIICYFDMNGLSSENWFRDKRNHGDEENYKIIKYFQYSHYLGALTRGGITEDDDEKKEIDEDDDEKEKDENHDRVFLTIWDLDSKDPLEAIHEVVVDGDYVGTYEDKVVLSYKQKISVISPNGDTKTIEVLGSGKSRVIGKYIVTPNKRDDEIIAAYGIGPDYELNSIYNMSTSELFKLEEKMTKIIPFEGNNDTFVLVDARYAEQKLSYQRYLFNGELKVLDATMREGELLGDTNHGTYQIYAAGGEVHIFNLKDLTDTLIWNFGEHEVSVIQFISKTRFVMLIDSLKLCYIYDITMKSFRKFSVSGSLSERDLSFTEPNVEFKVQTQSIIYDRFIIGVLSNSSFFYKIGGKLYLYSDQMTESIYIKNGESVDKIIEDINTHQLMVVQNIEGNTLIDVWM